MSLPFIEIKDGDSFLRFFSQSTDSDELCWHRDAEERKVIIRHCGKGWKFQFDNELPVFLNKLDTINIQKERWHRLHKGSGNLILEIIKNV